MKISTRIFLALALPAILLTSLSAHCEIPCGIYDDEARITLIREHIATIEKSMDQIMRLEKKETVNNNQLVRWISNKEKHADEIQEIVTQYFMTQRIKINTENYDKKLSILHQMLVASMKCKQTVDRGHVANLVKLTDEFQDLYFLKK